MESTYKEQLKSEQKKLDDCRKRYKQTLKLPHRKTEGSFTLSISLLAFLLRARRLA